MPRSFAAEAPARMKAGEPSRTARSAAIARALHQLIDSPRVFDDRFAIPIVAPITVGELRAALDGSSALRASIAMRSRYAEDRLAEAVTRGVRQYVILGAGLDTFALRNPHVPRKLRVFEVDHPATQQAKRERFAAVGMKPAPGATFVPVDFETQSLMRQLAASGFRADRPAFFSMLGVAVYLTEGAAMETLRAVAQCDPGTEIVFSFSVPLDRLGEAQRAGRLRAMRRMEEIGEPWITFYDPTALAQRLRDSGFRHAEVFTPADANRRYFDRRTDGLKVGSEHLMAARV